MHRTFVHEGTPTIVLGESGHRYAVIREDDSLIENVIAVDAEPETVRYLVSDDGATMLVEPVAIGDVVPFEWATASTEYSVLEWGPMLEDGSRVLVGAVTIADWYASQGYRIRRIDNSVGEEPKLGWRHDLETETFARVDPFPRWMPVPREFYDREHVAQLRRSAASAEARLKIAIASTLARWRIAA